MPTFIGLDLAWGGRNPHGYCVLEESGEGIRCTHMGSQAATVEVLAESVARVKARSDSVIVAIDAPLLFPTDPSSERSVDQLVKREFGFGLSAREARSRGLDAGVVLGESLGALGFTLDPSGLLEGSPDDHVAFEVYPHTIHIRLFHITERLAYKWGSKGQRQGELRKYQEHLRRLLAETAPVMLRSSLIRDFLSERAVENARSDEAIKRLDDALDGLTCALAAWLAWNNPGDWEMLGDMTGYMVMPSPASE